MNRPVVENACSVWWRKLEEEQNWEYIGVCACACVRDREGNIKKYLLGIS